MLGSFVFRDTLGAAQMLGLALSLAGSFWYGQEERKRRSSSPLKHTSSGLDNEAVKPEGSSAAQSLEGPVSVRILGRPSKARSGSVGLVLEP